MVLDSLAWSFWVFLSHHVIGGGGYQPLSSVKAECTSALSSPFLCFHNIPDNSWECFHHKETANVYSVPMTTLSLHNAHMHQNITFPHKYVQLCVNQKQHKTRIG